MPEIGIQGSSAKQVPYKTYPSRLNIMPHDEGQKTPFCLPATKKQIKLRYSASLCTLVIAFLWTNIPLRVILLQQAAVNRCT